MKKVVRRAPRPAGQTADSEAGRYKKLYSMLLDASPSSVLCLALDTPRTAFKSRESVPSR